MEDGVERMESHFLESVDLDFLAHASVYGFFEIFIPLFHVVIFFLKKIQIISFLSDCHDVIDFTKYLRAIHHSNCAYSK